MDLPGLKQPQEQEIKADPSAQLRLLDVQELDSKLDALAHQRRTVPEIEKIQGLLRERSEVDDEARDLRVEVDDLTAEQKKADRDVESVKARRERDQNMLDSGAIANPKDAERMLHELASLERRISDLEDVEIEVMERLETAQTELAKRTEKLAEINAWGKELVPARDQKLAELDEQIAETTTERELTAKDVPADLLGVYTKLREQKGGVGAALLRARQCGGCMLTLDALVLKDIAARADDDVVRCEECNRILVRTHESGLAAAVAND